MSNLTFLNVVNLHRRYYLFAFVIMLNSIGPLIAGSVVPLSSLDLASMTCGWGEAKANLSIAGQPISIRGRTFESGVGTHSPSRMQIDLHGKGERFTCFVGIDDSANEHGEAQFVVLADSEVVWDSGVITGTSHAQEVDLDIRDVMVLELRVVEGKSGGEYDHADWANAMLSMLPDAPNPVAITPYETIDLDTESFSLQFKVGDDRRLYQIPIGTENSKPQRERFNIAYPQGGDGYVFEPAFQVVHADGDRSTSLTYVRTERQELDKERELVRILLQDNFFHLMSFFAFAYIDKEILSNSGAKSRTMKTSLSHWRGWHRPPCYSTHKTFHCSTSMVIGQMK